MLAQICFKFSESILTDSTTMIKFYHNEILDAITKPSFFAFFSMILWSMMKFVDPCLHVFSTIYRDKLGGEMKL